MNYEDFKEAKFEWEKNPGPLSLILHIEYLHILVFKKYFFNLSNYLVFMLKLEKNFQNILWVLNEVAVFFSLMLHLFSGIKCSFYVLLRKQ